MEDRQLTKNFRLSEFTYSSAAKKNIEPTDFQIEMLRLLCEKLLQPIRDKFGPLRVTSGIRDRDIYDALVKRGYPVSKTSDHFLVPFLERKKGEWVAPVWAPNPRGKGAADFFPLKADCWDIYYWVFDNFKESVDYNQVIIYPKEYSDMNGSFIHISNPARLFIAPHIVSSRRPKLVYTGGNKKFDTKYTHWEVFLQKMGKDFKHGR